MFRYSGTKKTYRCNIESLRYYRNQKSWTQQQLANAAGYSERLICKAESGGTLSVATIKDLAAALSTAEQTLELNDLIFHPVELAREFVTGLYTDTQRLLKQLDQFLHENAVFCVVGTRSEQSVMESCQGIHNVKRFYESFFNAFETNHPQGIKNRFEFFCEGNVVVAWGEAWLQPIGQQNLKPMAVSKRLKFDSGKLIELMDRRIILDQAETNSLNRSQSENPDRFSQSKTN